ncbi:hypothetical protein [Gracilimonas halophila]|uniref:DUF4412 domain-containing protein n=1 Tax=Gracilimonas halophila TaxID=1834464 RepID=A0ABW5JMI9_9BACT
MNKGRLFISTLILFCSVFSISAFAQFEGQISMNLYSEENGVTEVSELNLYATSDRIMIKGEEDFDLMSQMSTDGLLIRNDRKDFVIMTGNNQALQVTKEEIEGLVDMMAGWSENGNGSDDKPKRKTTYSFSDRTQNIIGFDAAELIVEDAENPNKHLSIWLTNDIDVNWGMLGERWNKLPADIDAEVNGMAQEIIFKGKNFPLKIEAVENGKRVTLMDVSNVNRSSIAKGMVEVPSGVTLMSFKDFVFQMMMQQ